MMLAPGAIAEYVFWTLLLLIAHTYVLYPGVLFLAYAGAQVRADLRYLTLRRERRCRRFVADELPAVTMIVPAFNEERHLPAKIANVETLEYPRDRLQVIVVSDGSTDRTNEILHRAEAPVIEPVVLRRRSGKAAALNAGVARARYDVLVFSDASTMFAPDALRQLVRHFRNSGVGVVCGALGFRGGDEFRRTEGVYWRYESMLRLMEGRLGATLTASGAIYALRRACFEPLAAEDVIDDFVVPMRARRLGYRVIFDPEAEAVDVAADSVKDEFARRVRLAVGSFKALGELCRVPMSAMTYFAFLSHKVLRWILPFLLIGLAATNLLLLEGPVYRSLLAGQAAFYLWAAVGFILRRRSRRPPLTSLCYFLVAINVAFLVGFMRFLRGRQETAWQRVA
jgi:cellulose synthase/poly-beta-1,6-N-acetylglucosamine synthase-like glycosyltransferase